MHTELVERRRWISEHRFLHALNYCMMLPGPEAQQLATYIGWLFHGIRGGIVAGVLFILPGFFVLVALSWVYMKFGTLPLVASMLTGLKAAVVAIVAAAVIRVARRSLKNWVMASLAAGAFASLFFFNTPFPLVVLVAAIVGMLGGVIWPRYFQISPQPDESPNESFESVGSHRSLAGLALVLGICAALWVGPLLILKFFEPPGAIFATQANFFTKAAMVTFGGAYAVLPYIAQAGVETYHWLEPHQMIDGLGLAETTPGPLILVITFVGFVSGWTHPAGLTPEVAALLAAVVVTYFTFLPSFLWIFAGAPYIEQTRGNVRVSSALSAITAAVVGVILNLAFYFGRHVFFPGPAFFDVPAFIFSVVIFIGLTKFRWEILYVVAGSLAAGWFRGFAGF